MNKWIVGNSLDVMRDMPSGSVSTVLADPPYNEAELINQAIVSARRLCTGVTMFFMHLEDIQFLQERPDRVYVWLKPPSPKNFAARFSRFVEAICVYDVARQAYVDTMYWSNNTGVFNDVLISKPVHPYAKPESLIERLLALHGSASGTVLDPFAGSGTVHKVAKRLGIPSISIEIDSKWNEGK